MERTTETNVSLIGILIVICVSQAINITVSCYSVM